MSLKNKILLFVVNDPAFFLSHRLPLAVQAMKDGYTVHVATDNGAAVDKIISMGFVFHYLPFNRSSVNPLKEIRTILLLFKLYLNIRPDILHHVTIKPILYGSLVARLVRTPSVVNAISGLGYVFSGQGLKPRLFRIPVVILYRIAFGHPNSIVIVQNKYDREMVLKHKWTTANNIRLIRGSGADLNLFRKTPEVAGVPIIVLAGRLLWDKGVGVFVNAAALLREQHINARFVLVGNPDSGNPKCVPKYQIEKWVNEGLIEWWGFHSDMAKIFQQVHIVTLPTYYGEGVPKVLIEAAATGKPIVATDIPGCKEIVDDGVNGFLVSTHDEVVLSEALLKLINDKNLRNQMGQKSREKAEFGFSVDLVIKMTMDIYTELQI